MKSNLCSKFKGNYQKSYSDVTLREVEKIIKGIGLDQIINMWSHSYKTLNDENQKFIGMIKGEIKGYPFLNSFIIFNLLYSNESSAR